MLLKYRRENEGEKNEGKRINEKKAEITQQQVNIGINDVLF